MKRTRSCIRRALSLSLAALLLAGERPSAVRVDTPAGIPVEAELLDYAADLVASGRYIKTDSAGLVHKNAQ